MDDRSVGRVSRRQMLRLSAIGAMSVAGTTVLTACGAAPATGEVAVPARLRFGVGPLQSTPDESEKAFEPFFKYLAGKLGTTYDLVATTDWAGIAVALANDQVDLAWMGPWGYVLANDSAGAQAVATASQFTTRSSWGCGAAGSWPMFRQSILTRRSIPVFIALRSSSPASGSYSVRNSASTIRERSIAWLSGAASSAFEDYERLVDELGSHPHVAARTRHFLKLGGYV